MRSVLVALGVAVALAACLAHSTAQAQTAQAQTAGADLKAGMASDALRLLQQHDAAAAEAAPSPKLSFLAPTPAQTVGEAELERFLSAGAASLRGLHVRDDPAQPPGRDPYFEGDFKRTRHAYLERDLVTYDSGVYAIPGEAAYVGTFSYFGQPTEEWETHPNGSFVVVGKRLGWDGRSDTGIYIAEQAIAGFGLRFVRATPEYLDQFERRHLAAVEAYRREVAEEASGGLDLGAVLALGFGAALIGSSDLPGMDKLRLGQAFVSDVMGEGDGQALLGIARSGLPGGGGLFTGGQSFRTPGLDGLLAGAVTGQAPVAQATAAGGAAQAAQTAATTETFSFTCPAGDRHSIPVTYRNPACGAAMKTFAEVYGCNLIGDFALAGQRCQQACGHPQCAEVR
ncbi:MAG: hypothetical protein WD341_10515 [Tistlia sp.]|uniref:hypothetical protein n=1 Tax=Tistlia sp. TaxID=3057121 RepID=UPI0034A27C0D